MPSRSEEWEASLDLNMDKHKLRIYRLQTSLCFAAISILSLLEAFYQNLTRQVVSHPPWWFAWVIFGVNSLMFFMFAIARFMSAKSLGSLSSWEDDIMLRSRRGVLFPNRGSVGRDEMTTPEVSGSTSTSYRDSLKSRSAARNGTTPQRLKIGGDGKEPTPGYKMPDERKPFSSVDIFG